MAHSGPAGGLASKEAPQPLEPAREQAPQATGLRSGGDRVQAVERAFLLLDVLSHREAGVSQLARATGLHKATVHRLLQTLLHVGAVEVGAEKGRYRLGLRLLELGGRVLARFELREVAGPYLARFRDETLLTVHMAVLDGTDIVYIEKLDAPTSIHMASTVGSRFPAYCTALGKAILAHLPEAELEAVLSQTEFEARTPRTITSADALREHLAMVRSRGYAVDDSENEEGIRCVGAPIFGYTGRVMAALSASGPIFSVTPERVPGLGRMVARVAREISRAMGYPLGS
ncbi:IclR family transcriptional regulator [Limnochorda sp.]|uniref:IclR family transcriptional regulator n=1 Tax=Limnochorda sp. TaxID=1940279 RepID=UPI0039C24E6A